ncbi:RNA polymerase sigma factor [Fictibacillus sp. BK138]|uniref:RNA polymerase sigma factor n=1 Tax=Fictibacillus sp. BK138 TaxID=2512121 RepID=UPI001029E559|nr:RNA polymerase sigma factor [Fictibacillus sp. BK138]RZT23527.1 RNA polymerase sigma-70 factor (ECF subfamily) [Fictibacillus sp. BK138]
MKNNELIQRWFIEYHNDIYNFLIYYMGTKDVEDIVQEVFIKGFNHVSQFEGRSDPKTWLISIARNIAIDHIRKKKRHQMLFSVLMSLSSEKEKVPQELVIESEQKKELYQAINQLKASYRDIAILRGVMDYTPEEASQILNWKIAKVNLTYHRAIQSLKKKLEAEKWSDNVESINE